MTGIFISSDLPGRIEAVFGKRTSLGRDDLNLLTRAVVDPTSNFDDFYVALYTLSLYGRDFPVAPALAREQMVASGRRPVMDFEIFSDLPIGYARPGATFSETVLDEFVVAEAYNLRTEIGQLIPLKSFVSEASVGCLYMKFTVLADPTRVPNGQAPKSFNEVLLQTSENWQNIARRYLIRTHHTALIAH